MNESKKVEGEIIQKSLDNYFSLAFDRFFSNEKRRIFEVYGTGAYRGYLFPFMADERVFVFFPLEKEKELENLKTVFVETRGIFGLTLDGFFVFPEILRLKEVISLFNGVFFRGIEFVMKSEDKISKVVHFNNAVEVVKNFGYLVVYNLRNYEESRESNEYLQWRSGLCYNCKVRLYPKSYLDKIKVPYLIFKIDDNSDFSLVADSFVFLKKS